MKIEPLSEENMDAISKASMALQEIKRNPVDDVEQYKAFFAEHGDYLMLATEALMEAENYIRQQAA